ncbi:DUF1049 domain-containing protein [Aerococcaceae bacterium DSM 111020]|nr:DUF1049 domain-containing protein [Aerococcaceae bacterium DSM 111020]
MKNQAKLILGIIILIIITVFAIQNTKSVELDLIFTHFETPLVLIILFSVLLGVIVGMIGAATNTSAKSREIKKLNRQVEKEKDLRKQELIDKDAKIAELRSQLSEKDLKDRNTTVYDSLVETPVSDTSSKDDIY